MTDNEIKKAFDILDKFEFFGGQRAGRELWFNKPADIQEKDIGGFLRDIDFLKQFINRQKAEIERLNGAVQEWVDGKCLSQKHLLMIGKLQNEIEQAKSKAIKEFAERLKENAASYEVTTAYAEGEEVEAVEVKVINNLVKEMTEGKP